MASAVLDSVFGSPLLAALDGLAAVDPASLGETLLGERITELLVASDRVASLVAHAVAEGEARGLVGSRMNPQGLTGSWVAGLAPAKLGRPVVSRLVVRAQVVAGLPLVAGLHAQGEVSTAFLDAAGAGLRQLPAEAHGSWDALLAGEGRDLDPADVGRLLAQVRVMVDPDGVGEEAGRARSSFHISAYGSVGSWALKGTLHGLEGELVASMIDQYARPRDANDLRSRGERNAAALVQIFRIAERSSRDPEFWAAPRGAAGHVVVHVNADTWHGRPGAPAATTAAGTVLDPGAFETVRCTTAPEVLLTRLTDNGTADEQADVHVADDPTADDATGDNPNADEPNVDEPNVDEPVDKAEAGVDVAANVAADAAYVAGDDPADAGIDVAADAPTAGDTGGRGTVETGTVETESEAQRDARLVREILAGLIGPEIGIGIEPLAYGRGLRGASRAQWNALVARDGHCVLPGCTRDPSWCEAHHTREWDADTGPTDLVNLALVCWEHHPWLHRNHLHLHPPWCRCTTCPDTRRRHSTPAHGWLTLGHPPILGDPPART